MGVHNDQAGHDLVSSPDSGGGNGLQLGHVGAAAGVAPAAREVALAAKLLVLMGEQAHAAVPAPGGEAVGLASSGAYSSNAQLFHVTCTSLCN